MWILNPVRAGMAESLEDSAHTAIAARVDASCGADALSDDEVQAPLDASVYRLRCWCSATWTARPRRWSTCRARARWLSLACPKRTPTLIAVLNSIS
jgi:hypothetical protein